MLTHFEQCLGLCMIPGGPNQGMQVQHTATVALNHAKVVRYMTQDSHAAAVGPKQVVENGGADQMEELRHSDRVRNRQDFPDGSASEPYRTPQGGHPPSYYKVP